MSTDQTAAGAGKRIFVKLRPSASLAAAESRVKLRPLRATVPGATAPMGIGAEPQWFLADLPDGAPTPWDLAHASVANQLGVTESDVLCAEPALALAAMRIHR